MSRILIVSVSAGAGHIRAAAAVEKALKERRPEIEVRNVDLLQHASTAYRRGYGQAYMAIVRHLPALWGLLYTSTDRQEAKSAAGRLRILVDRHNARPFLKLVRDFAPDRILSTHFMPAGVISREKKKGRLSVPLHVTLTAPDVHTFWIYDEVDRYYAPDEEVAFVCARRGVPEERIRVGGIPIDPVFSRLPDREAARQAIGLAAKKEGEGGEGDEGGEGGGPGAPTVLIASGGFGVGGIEETARAAFNAAERAGGAPVNVVAVCGRNKKLEEKIRRIEAPPNARLVVFGFTDRMHDLMAASDIAVTKPGGLTTSECLAAGLPMVGVDPIPGQEEGNRDFLLEHGAAVAARNPWSLERMRKIAASRGRPDAAGVVADDLARGL